EFVGDQSLVVVGDHQRIELLQISKEGAQNLFLGTGVQWLAALVIDANDLLVARNDARLDCSHAPGVCDDPFVIDSGTAEALTQRPAWLISAGDAEGGNLSTQSRQVCRNVTRAAEAFTLTLVINNRDGGLRRQPGGGSPKITVQHEVANHSDAPASQAGD